MKSVDPAKIALSIIEEDLGRIIAADLPWNSLKGCQFLISGAAGLIGAYLVRTLLLLNSEKKLNISIIGLVRNKQKAVAQFGENAARIVLEERDICEPLDFKGPIDFIIHAASQASPKFYGKDPVGTLLPNTAGTLRLLELASRKKVKGFLFLSSAEIYGDMQNSSGLISEGMLGGVDPVNARSCYAESKRMGESMCVSWFHQYGVPAKIARLFHSYGPGMKLDDGRVFADFVANIARGENIQMKSDGGARRAFCYAADAVTALFTVLLKGKSGEAYNIGNPKAETTILELATLLVSLFPERKLKVSRVASKSDTDGYLQTKVDRACPDIAKIAELGWEPSLDLREGFSRTIRYYDEPN